MAKDPRPPEPGPSEPDDALDLLRALARARQPSQAPPPPQPAPPPAATGDEKMDALRALAEKLDLQLRGVPPAAPASGLPPQHPPGPPAAGPHPPSPSSPPATEPGDETPPVPAWHERLSETARREWRALVAALPPAAALVPRFGRIQFVFIGVSIGVLLIAAIGGVVGPRNPQAPSADVVPPLVPPAGPGMQAAPAAPAVDLAAITKAMSDCDAEAIKLPDQLHFFVLPMLPSKGAENDWRNLALQEVGNTFLLLSAKDALDGLRDGKLVVRDGRYTFSVLDSATGQSYSWTSATRISRLSRPAPKEVKSLKLGFDFSTTQAGPQWSNEFRRDPGTCYWVSVLVKP
jgi:hypothetical protein